MPDWIAPFLMGLIPSLALTVRHLPLHRHDWTPWTDWMGMRSATSYHWRRMRRCRKCREVQEDMVGQHDCWDLIMEHPCGHQDMYAALMDDGFTVRQMERELGIGRDVVTLSFPDDED